MAKEKEWTARNVL